MQEKLEKQKRDREIAEKAQRLALDKLCRDIQNERWQEFTRLQERLHSEEEAKWHRSFSYDKIKKKILKQLHNIQV